MRSLDFDQIFVWGWQSEALQPSFRFLHDNNSSVLHARLVALLSSYWLHFAILYVSRARPMFLALLFLFYSCSICLVFFVYLYCCGRTQQILIIPIMLADFLFVHRELSEYTCNPTISETIYRVTHTVCELWSSSHPSIMNNTTSGDEPSLSRELYQLACKALTHCHQSKSIQLKLLRSY